MLSAPHEGRGGKPYLEKEQRFNNYWSEKLARLSLLVMADREK